MACTEFNPEKPYKKMEFKFLKVFLVSFFFCAHAVLICNLSLRAFLISVSFDICEELSSLYDSMRSVSQVLFAVDSSCEG